MRKDRIGVSVIIPVYNGERYIAEALESVLRQTHPVKEIIVVDDGSRDRTPDILERYRGKIQLIRQDNSGIGAAINRGIAAARGRAFAFLDADDLWVRKKIELQVRALRVENVDMVFGMVKNFISPDLDETQRGKLICPERNLPGYTSGTLLIKRAPFERVGSFSTQYRLGEFIEWFSRAEQAGLSSFLLPEVVLKRRLHTSNTTNQASLERADYLKILRSRLEMKRNSSTEI